MLNKVNLICYKAACIIGIIAFAITGAKILWDDLYIRAMIVLVSAAALSLLLFQKPSFRAWLQVAAIVIVAFITINNIAKIW